MEDYIEIIEDWTERKIYYLNKDGDRVFLRDIPLEIPQPIKFIRKN